MVKEIRFKNIEKIFPKNIIRKMRQEDLQKFFIDKKRFMTKLEREEFEKDIFGQGTFPSGNEFLVERNKGKLKFIRFD